MPEADPRTLNLAGLRSLARDIGKRLTAGSVVWLEGGLGAGKTTFAAMLVEELGGHQPSSPTFAMLQEYSTDGGVVAHADCYRLRDPQEAFDLDLWAVAAGSRLLLVEWPEKGGSHVPPPSLRVRLSYAGNPDDRIVSVVQC